MDSILEAARVIAEFPTSDETPGVAPDQFEDELIRAARSYVFHMTADLKQQPS
jgi:hypothetical protein